MVGNFAIGLLVEVSSSAIQYHKDHREGGLQASRVMESLCSLETLSGRSPAPLIDTHMSEAFRRLCLLHLENPRPAPASPSKDSFFGKGCICMQVSEMPWASHG